MVFGGTDKIQSLKTLVALTLNPTENTKHRFFSDLQDYLPLLHVCIHLTASLLL